MCPSWMWKGDKPVRQSTWGMDRCGLRWRPKPKPLLRLWRRRRLDRGWQHLQSLVLETTRSAFVLCGLRVPHINQTHQTSRDLISFTYFHCKSDLKP
ncbi:hypothetical protein SDJN03_21810, partial [Cucurbita argyrosperma subsp. sororia]